MLIVTFLHLLAWEKGFYHFLLKTLGIFIINTLIITQLDKKKSN